MLNVKWDCFETAKLIELYFKVKKCEVKGGRKTILESFSNLLRKYGALRGYKIDSKYRNYNGMQLQLLRMTYLLSNGKKGLPNPTKMFIETYNIYRDNHEEYLEMLNEANKRMQISENLEGETIENSALREEMVDSIKQKKEFKKWLRRNYSIKGASRVLNLISEIDKEAKYIDLISESLYEITSKEKIKEIVNYLKEKTLFVFKNTNKVKDIDIAVSMYLKYLEYFKYNKNRNSSVFIKAKLAENSKKNIHIKDNIQNNILENKFSNSNDIELLQNDKDVLIIGKEEKIKAGKILEIDFKNIVPLENSNPVEYSYYSVRDVFTNWQDVYARAIKLLFIVHKDVIIRKYLNQNPNDKSIVLVNNTKIYDLAKPRKITEDIYLETNLGPTNIVQNISELFFLCDINLKKVKLKYKFICQDISDKKKEKASIKKEEIRDGIEEKTKNNEKSEGNERSNEFKFQILEKYLEKLESKSKKVVKENITLDINQNSLKAYEETTIESTKGNNNQKTFPLVNEVVKVNSMKSDGFKLCKKTVDNNTVQVVDFNNIVSLENTKPIEISFFWLAKKVESWKDVYVKLCKLLFVNYRSLILYSFLNKEIDGVNKFCFCDTKNRKAMNLPEKVWQNVYVETDFSSVNIVKRIIKLLNLCNIGYDNIVIKYKYFEESNEATERLENSDAFIETDDKLSYNNREILSLGKNMRTLFKAEEYSFDTSIYKEVLKEKFSNGILTEQRLNMKKFKRYLSEKSESEVTENLDILVSNINKITIKYGKKNYLPEIVVSIEIRTEIFEFIKKQFKSGVNAIYYEVLFKEFTEKLNGKIYDFEMLKTYLEYYLRQQYFFDQYFFSQNEKVKVDIVEEIKTVMIKEGCPLTYNKISKLLPYLPLDNVKNTISRTDEFINNNKFEYFYAENIYITKNEMNGIIENMDREIKDNDFINSSDIREIIKIKFPLIYGQLEKITNAGIRKFFAYRLGNRFSFNRNLITAINSKISKNDIISNFCTRKGFFTLEELNALKNELETNICFEKVYESSLRISENEFVPKDMASFNINEIDKILEILCPENYIAIGEINDYNLFTNANYKWNEYLLESYLFSYSNKFKLLHNSFSFGSCVGAIVKKSSCYNNYDDVLIDVLKSSAKEFNKKEALDYLYNQGYLTRRIYNKIDTILLKAKAFNNLKG